MLLKDYYYGDQGEQAESYRIVCDICQDFMAPRSDEEDAYKAAEEDGWKTNFNGEGLDYCDECFKDINDR